MADSLSAKKFDYLSVIAYVSSWQEVQCPVGYIILTIVIKLYQPVKWVEWGEGLVAAVALNFHIPNPGNYI